MSDGKNVSLQEWLEWGYQFVTVKGGEAHVVVRIDDDPHYPDCEMVIDLKIRKREADENE